MNDFERNNEKVKKMFDDWYIWDDELRAVKKDKKELLDKDDKYQQLLKQKQDILEEIKEREFQVAQSLLDEIEKHQETIKDIKGSLAEHYDKPSAYISDVYGYYRFKKDKRKDKLHDVTTIWVETFELNSDDSENK